MFKIENHLAKITSCTNRSEKHGKQREPAISIGLTVTGSGALLDHFDGALRTMLFRRPQPKPGDLPMEDGNDLVELRFPFMRNLDWPNKYAGYTLRFHIGASGADDVLLGECGLKDIRFTTQEGGNVGVSFMVSAHPKDDEDHGKIARRVQQEIFVTLLPPEKPVDLLGDTSAPAASKRGKRTSKKAPSTDPFAHSDLAQDDTRIESTLEGVWPFPRPDSTHDEGEPPVDGESEDEEQSA